MRRFAETCEAIAATTKKLQKTAIVADYFKLCGVDEAAKSAIFLSGRPFAAWEEATLQIGGVLLWRLVAGLSGRSAADITAAYRRTGDLGAIAGEVLPEHAGQGVEILEVSKTFHRIASTRGSAAKAVLVRDLLARATPLEAKYIIKIMTGDLRIGLKESLVEEAIAKAYAAPLADVQSANMLLGDIEETLRLAFEGQLSKAKMRMFHAIGFMLASPIDSTEQGLSYFAEAAVEDKYDGIRAQAHVSHGEVKLFSRTRDEITESFPELPQALAELPQDAILDGEIVAWEFPENKASSQPVVDEKFSIASEKRAEKLGHARPFSVLQQRLGRKKVSDKMLRETPVVFLAFDVLYANGELLIDRPLRERGQILDHLVGAIHRENSTSLRSRSAAKMVSGNPQSTLDFATDACNGTVGIIRAPVFRAAASDELEELFTAAQARGNEGLMIKDLDSAYLPGKRGKSWLKMKRELATLDEVVTAVEYGHGKRVGVLSDYTFAVWDTNSDKNKGRLVNIGKAYSGLTDAEIAAMTQWFLDHTIEDQGFRRTVEPKVVLEVAFNNMMRSERHESGYALRFPRIVRLRPDKSPEDADTIERVREIFERQAK
ncbi:MAG: ATP-dependent DNA ligase [Candidatus Sulfotelmatobacter sp.]